MMREISLITLLSLLYLPVFIFSVGVSLSGMGRVYRQPNKLEPLILAPLSLIYLLLSLGLAKLLIVWIVDDVATLNRLVSDLFYPIKSLITEIADKDILHDKTLSFMSSGPTSPPIYSITLLLCFYIFFIIIYPLFVGYYVANIQTSRDFIIRAFTSVRQEYLLYRYYLKDSSRFIVAYKMRLSILKALATMVFFPFWIFPLILFNLLKKAKLLDYVLRFTTNSTIPQEMSGIYNPNRAIIADITLSDKKMISGIVAGVEVVNDRISQYRIENPVRWERTERLQKNISNNGQKEYVSQFWKNKSAVIPGLSLFIPSDKVLDININDVPLDLFVSVKSLKPDPNNIPQNTAAFIDLFKDLLKEKLKTKFFFSRVYIIYIENSLDQDMIRTYFKERFLFDNIWLVVAPDEEFRDIAKYIVDQRDHFVEV